MRTSGISERTVAVGDIHVHIAEAGDGPLVLLLHGFPECSYSWRHQLPELGRAGFHAVAPDLRGYGRTDSPPEPSKYTILHLVGDVIGLIELLGQDRSVVVGHDWGAHVAWHAALIRPDRIAGVVGLSVPPTPPGVRRPGSVPAVDQYRHYETYFQQPGRADAELGRDVRDTVLRILHSLSGDGAPWDPVIPAGQTFLDIVALPARLPSWLSEEDLSFVVGEFRRTGFSGGLNYYRNIDYNTELLGAWREAVVEPPALYVVGDRDIALTQPEAGDLITAGSPFVPHLRDAIVIPGCGHWTQQERPAGVTQALVAFLSWLGGGNNWVDR